MPMVVRYNRTSSFDPISLPMGVSTLLGSVSNMVIVASLTLRIQAGTNSNGTKVECGIGEMDSVTEIWIINGMGECMTRLSI